MIIDDTREIIALSIDLSSIHGFSLLFSGSSLILLFIFAHCDWVFHGDVYRQRGVCVFVFDVSMKIRWVTDHRSAWWESCSRRYSSGFVDHLSLRWIIMDLCDRRYWTQIWWRVDRDLHLEAKKPLIIVVFINHINWLFSKHCLANLLRESVTLFELLYHSILMDRLKERFSNRQRFNWRDHSFRPVTLFFISDRFGGENVAGWWSIGTPWETIRHLKSTNSSSNDQ